MGMFNNLLSEAYALKEKDYVKEGYIKPRDIEPNIRWLGVAFAGSVIAIIFSEWWVKILIVGIFFSLSRAFFRGSVKL